MDSFQSRLHQWDVQWQVRREADEIERGRLHILNGPPPKNPPELLALTKVRVVRPFCVAGKRLEVGDVVSVEAHLARDLVAVGKAELLK